MKNEIYKKIKLFLIFIFSFSIVFLFGMVSGFYLNKFIEKRKIIQEENDIYLLFSMEIYDKIMNNYWEKIADEDLANLYKLTIEKITQKTQLLEKKDREGIKKLIKKNIQTMDEKRKKDFVVKLSDLILQSLIPQGRSRLYTQKEEIQLKEMVQNIDRSTDLYQILGVEKDAPQEKIEKIYQEKIFQLSQEKTPEAKEEMEKLERAYETLSEPDRRKIYNDTGIEPTVIGKLVGEEILHLKIKRISPTTLDELRGTTEKFDKGDLLNTLILDLRGNIGGSVDLLPYLLGPFIGQNQYAYEFFRKGEYIPYKTTTGWLPSLVRYKKVIILIDNQTQSSAEIMAAVLKKYNVGVLLGERTRGWGTIEAVFNLDNQIDLNEKYSIFLVHTITIREDGLPIEGRGIEPVIDIKNPNWEKELFAYYPDFSLIEAVKKILNE